MTTTIDTRGLFCPLPITFVSRKLRHMREGAHAEILADDRSFRRDLESWCLETGNRLVDFKEKEGCYHAMIQRGSGFHGDALWEKADFLLLGVKVHITQWVTRIIPGLTPKFLITFVSIAEGQRAGRFLKEQGFSDYRLLPVPDAIYPHCGLVFGMTRKETALKIFKVLRDASYAVEDIHRIDRSGTYPKLDNVMDE
ncbi:MAG: sulfurtransferase TusA family protein [Thermodesulfobacteriota bacterium]|nr:sulfurtransferase TusA family protein [Thermodesulfobacteriota bacterium]